MLNRFHTIVYAIGLFLCHPTFATECDGNEIELAVTQVLSILNSEINPAFDSPKELFDHINAQNKTSDYGMDAHLLSSRGVVAETTAQRIQESGKTAVATLFEVLDRAGYGAMKLSEAQQKALTEYGKETVYLEMDGALREGKPQKTPELVDYLKLLDSTMTLAPEIGLSIKGGELYRGGTLKWNEVSGKMKVGAKWHIAEFTSTTHRPLVALKFASRGAHETQFGDLLFDIIDTRGSKVKGVEMNLSEAYIKFGYEEEVLLNRNINVEVTGITSRPLPWGGTIHFRHLKMSVAD